MNLYLQIMKKGKKNKKNPLSSIKPNRIIYPIIIGLIVVSFMLFREFTPGSFQSLNFTNYSYIWVIIAVLCMLNRDIGYMIRLKILSNNHFTWYQSFKIIMLWEFSSAITPTAIGGTSVAVVYVHKEGLSIGKSTALVMATSLLDELYSIIMFPLLFLILSPKSLFIINGEAGEGALPFLNEFFYFAIFGYLFKLAWVLLIIYGLFFNPKGFKWLLIRVFRIRFLRRWIDSAIEAGNEIVHSSKELKRKPFTFWLKAFGATFLSWTSRYWVVNAMLLAFFTVQDHFLIYARQLVMWIMMIVSPTPGGSGFAEFVFKEYLSEFILTDPAAVGSIVIAMALLWRLISYYPYLFIGVIIFPRWIRNKFGRKTKKESVVKSHKSYQVTSHKKKLPNTT